MFVLFGLTALVLTQGVRGEERAGDEPGSELHVYVLTFSPGDEPWEKFGHNAVRIINDNRDDDDVMHDLAFNWGMFDFGAGKIAFACNFLQGRLIYSMGATRGRETIDDYIQKQNRTVLQQELNLSSSQKMRLYSQLLKIIRDDDLRHYRYDYYNNNCSSKVRDVIDDLCDHRLAAVSKGIPSGSTFRSQTARLTASPPWLYVLLQGALGQPVDHPIDEWQEMFLPQKLHDRLNDVTVHLNGYDVKLVKQDQVLYASTRPPEPSSPPVMSPWLLLAGVLFGALLAGLGHFARRHWAARWGFVLVSLPWLLLMGLGGAILWWGWLATDHVVVRHNENVMHVSILALPLIVMLPMLAFGRRRGALIGKRLVFAMVAISIIGLLLKVLPWFYQMNWPIIAMCLPVNIALAYAAWVMAKSPAPVRDPKEKKAVRGKQKAVPTA